MTEKSDGDKRLHSPQIQKTVSSGLQVIELRRESGTEYFITAVPHGAESPNDIFPKAAQAVRQNQARVVSQEIFGISDSDGIASKAWSEAFEGIEGPVTWLEDGHDVPLCGTHVWALANAPVQPIEIDGRLIGSTFTDPWAKFCRISGILPPDISASRSDQASYAIKKLQQILHSEDMDYPQAFRTWFYNDKILEWYDEFNRVRNDIYQQWGIFDGLVPASTGVGGQNPTGAALVGGLLAVQPLSDECSVQAVISPLQNPAWDYGSSFSRAVELDLPDHHRIFVSGTASIDPEGNTVHLNDTRAQVKLTMEVVYAILESRHMDWADVTRALAYFKHARDSHLFEDYRRENQIPDFPVVVAENDICRDDLLFELEVDAVRLK
jgi:enamine deaminase RidA (YjgF/YER057c/UK114 family)